jgi:hypothetical protein
VSPGATLINSVVGNCTTIGENAVLSGARIGDCVNIPASAYIQQTIPSTTCACLELLMHDPCAAEDTLWTQILELRRQLGSVVRAARVPALDILANQHCEQIKANSTRAAIALEPHIIANRWFSSCRMRCPHVVQVSTVSAVTISQIYNAITEWYSLLTNVNINNFGLFCSEWECCGVMVETQSTC